MGLEVAGRMQERNEPVSRQEDDSREDADLMRDIAGGDERAFRRLVRRHLAGAARLAQRVLGNAAAAEDVAQEAFIRVWKHASNFEDPAARGARFSTWLYRIVVNLCIDEKRKRSGTALEDIPEPADETPDAEGGLQQREQSARVRAALDALPERQRTALVLSFYEDYSNKEAAALMGIGLKALESLLVRARKTLREQLQQERSGT